MARARLLCLAVLLLLTRLWLSLSCCMLARDRLWRRCVRLILAMLLACLLRV